MNIVLKDKIRINNNFINDLISKSWQDSESIQNQIDSIEVDSPQATKVVKLLRDLLTSYYVFTGCLETLENEPTEITKSAEFVKPEVSVSETPTIIPEELVKIEVPATDMLIELEDNNDSEPFEYFVDFDEPTGEPLTDDDLYN